MLLVTHMKKNLGRMKGKLIKRVACRGLRKTWEQEFVAYTFYSAVGVFLGPFECIT